MKAETKWFGTIEIKEDKILTFEKGIIGFENFDKYTIIFDVDKEEETSIMWLQSLDEPALALPVIRPEIVLPEYDPIVEDEMIDALGSDIKNANILVLCALTVPSELKNMTCNLKAPIIINADTLKGAQMIADNDDYMVRYPIYDILNAKREGK